MIVTWKTATIELHGRPWRFTMPKTFWDTLDAKAGDGVHDPFEWWFVMVVVQIQKELEGGGR